VLTADGQPMDVMKLHKWYPMRVILQNSRTSTLHVANHPIPLEPISPGLTPRRFLGERFPSRTCAHGTGKTAVESHDDYCGTLCQAHCSLSVTSGNFIVLFVT